MCLIVLGYHQHPRYPLVVAANRDEAYDRPTRAARFWNSSGDILAGKDLEAGGTWMGIQRSGKFSAITNFRDPDIVKENPPSRGHLVLDFLKGSQSPREYLQGVDQKADRYMGFNLLAGTPAGLYYYSNQQQKIQELAPGLHGLSNHLLNTPWPKVRRAKEQLGNLIENNRLTEEALFQLLADNTRAPDDQLPDTGIPKEIEKQVSPVFIQGEKYGTRCSTILLVGRDGGVTFTERRFEAGTRNVTEENRYTFSLQKQQPHAG